MGGGASIPLPEFMTRAEARVLAGRGKYSEDKFLQVARQNLPLGQEPDDKTLISKSQFLAGFLGEYSTDEESEDSDDESAILNDIQMPNSDQTVVSCQQVQQFIGAEDWSPRVVELFDSLVDDYRCISIAHYVSRILPCIKKQRIANRRRIKAEQARQAELENRMATKLQAAARGFLNRSKDVTKQAEGFEFERVWLRLSKSEQVLLSLLRKRYDTDPIRFLAQLKKIIAIWGKALAEHDKDAKRRKDAINNQTISSKKAAKLTNTKRSGAPEKFVPKSQEELDNERNQARAAKLREKQRKEALAEYEKCRQVVENLRLERSIYSIPHYDDIPAEVKAATKLAAIRRGKLTRKMYPRLAHRATIWIDKVPNAEFKSLFRKELEGVALVIDETVLSQFIDEGKAKIVKGSVWHMDVLESIAGEQFINRDLDPLNLLDMCINELDFPVHVTTTLREEDRTIFLRLSARFRQDPRRVYEHLRQLWIQLHPLAFDVPHPWCTNDDAIAAQHFHDIQRDLLRHKPYKTTYKMLQRWLCGAIDVASKQAVTKDGSVLTSHSGAAKNGPSLRNGVSSQKQFWPWPTDRLEPWVRKILSRWATYQDLRDPREDTFRTIQRASEQVIRDTGKAVEDRVYLGGKLSSRLGNIGLSEGASSVKGAARIDEVRYGDGDPVLLPTINLNWPSARQWQRRKFFQHSQSYVFLQMLLAKAMAPFFRLFCKLLIQADAGFKFEEVAFRSRTKAFDEMYHCMKRDAAAHEEDVAIAAERARRREKLEVEAENDLEIAELDIRRDMTAKALRDQLAKTAEAKQMAGSGSTLIADADESARTLESNVDSRTDEEKYDRNDISQLLTMEQTEKTPFTDMYGSAIPPVDAEIFNRLRYEQKLDEKEEAEFSQRKQKYSDARPSASAARVESASITQQLLRDHGCEVDSVMNFLKSCPESAHHKRTLQLLRRLNRRHKETQTTTDNTDESNPNYSLGRAAIERLYYPRLLLDHFPETPGLPQAIESRDALYAGLLDIVYGDRNDDQSDDKDDDRDLERGGPGAGVRRLERQPASFTDTIQCTAMAMNVDSVSKLSSRMLRWNMDKTNPFVNRNCTSDRSMPTESKVQEQASSRNDVDDAYARSTPVNEDDERQKTRLEILLSNSVPQTIAIHNGFSSRQPALAKARCGYREMGLSILFRPSPLLVKSLLVVLEAEELLARESSLHPRSLEEKMAQRKYHEAVETCWDMLLNPPPPSQRIDTAKLSDDMRKDRLRRSLSQNSSTRPSRVSSASQFRAKNREEEAAQAVAKAEAERLRAETITWGDIFSILGVDDPIHHEVNGAGSASSLESKVNHDDEIGTPNSPAVQPGPHSHLRFNGERGTWRKWEHAFFDGMPESRAMELRSELRKAKTFLASREFTSKSAALVSRLRIQLPQYRSLQQRQRLHLEVVAPSEPNAMQRHFATHVDQDEDVVLF